MSDYTEEIQLAYDEIFAAGQAVTITRNSAGSYDVATGSVTVTTSTENGYGVPTNFGSHEIDGTNIQRGDINLLLAASGISKPQINDTVTFSSKTYTIKDVTDIAPGGSSIVYKFQVRA